MNSQITDRSRQAPVTVVIVTYRSATTIEDTLRSVERCRAEGLADCVIVDNDSPDDTRKIVRRIAPWADLIESDCNLGFGRGCNLGLERVRSSCTLFLNPDARIEPASLRTLLDFLSCRPEVGIVGPATICHPQGGGEVLQPTGPLPSPRAVLPGRLARALGEPGLREIVPGEAPFETGWICGAVLLARTSLLHELGGFDPRFFLYWEETDLCRRARESGHQVWAVGTALAHHEVAVSSRDDPFKVNGCIARHYYQSRRYYMLKHHAWLPVSLAEIVEFGWILGASLLDLARGRGLDRLSRRTQARLLSLPAEAPERARSVAMVGARNA